MSDANGPAAVTSLVKQAVGRPRGERPAGGPAADQGVRPTVSRRAVLLAAAAVWPHHSAAQDGRGPMSLDAAEQAEVDAKYASVLRKYGTRLSEQQRTRVREVIGRHQRMLRSVRAFPLDNSDSPATGLRLYPNDTVPASAKRKE